MSQNTSCHSEFCADVEAQNCTPSFDQDQNLLTVRENASGKYLTREALEVWSNMYNVPLVEQA